DTAPVPCIALDELVYLCRSFASCRIEREGVHALFLPGIEDRLHDAPGGFDVVRPLEQARIADHAVIKQRLVTRARPSVEIVAIIEFHLDIADGHIGPRNLGTEFE